MRGHVKTLAILPGGRDHEHAAWFIGPVGHHRDSDLVEESNWDTMIAAYRAIDPDEQDHEVHRFGHFAVGWVEEIAYRPGSAVAAEADRLRARLEDYPILDDDAHSQMECDAASEAWSSWQSREVRRDITKVLLACDQECTEACMSSADELCTCDREARYAMREDIVDAFDDLRLHEIVTSNAELYDGHYHVRDTDIRKAADEIRKLCP